MLPTLAGRLLAIIGIACGVAGVYLSGWSRGPHGPAPQILFAAAVAALVAMRAAPKQLIDEDRLKASVGDDAVKRLSVWRGVGVAILALGLIPALVAPLISSDQVRHGALLVAAAVLLVSVAILVWVEVRYRALIRAAGGLTVLGKF